MWILALSGVILAVYIITLSPSIAGGDSGEIVAEGCLLGTGLNFFSLSLSFSTAHPPGYPLLTLII
jgi:hypothetical protein